MAEVEVVAARAARLDCLGFRANRILCDTPPRESSWASEICLDVRVGWGEEEDGKDCPARGLAGVAPITLDNGG